jgi:hypothetical protein
MIHSISEAFLNKQVYSGFFSSANFFSSFSKAIRDMKPLYISPFRPYHSSSRTTLRISHFKQINKYSSSDSFQIGLQNHQTSLFSKHIQITFPNHQEPLFSSRIHNVSSLSKSQELCALRVLPGFWAQYTCRGWRDV